MTKIRQNQPKESNKNTLYTTRQKLLKKSLKHKTIHRTIQYSDSNKSLNITVPKNHSNTKKNTHNEIKTQTNNAITVNQAVERVFAFSGGFSLLQRRQGREGRGRSISIDNLGICIKGYQRGVEYTTLPVFDMEDKFQALILPYESTVPSKISIIIN